MRLAGAFIRGSAVSAILGIAALGTWSQPAAADTWLDNQLFLQAAAGTQAQSFSHDTGHVASTSPLTQSQTVGVTFTDASTGGTAQAGASATATVFYGSFDVVGSGYASPVVRRDGAQSSLTPYIGGAPLLAYQDQLQVGSTTLAAGAPVTLTFTFSFDGSASVIGEGSGGVVSYSDISSEFRMSDEMNGPTRFDTTYTSAGIYTQTVTVAVGDVLDIYGALFAQGFAASYDAGGDSSFSFSDPTTEFIDASSGAFLTAASGHDYSTPNAVPEPASLAIFGAALAGLGLMWQRKRA